MRLLLIEDDAALRLGLACQLEADGYRVDQAAQIARLNGEVMDLTAYEYRVLEYLLRERARIVSKQECPTTCTRTTKTGTAMSWRC